MSTKQYRYKAFISYSSTNRAEAERLQKALEAYRIPTDIEPEQSFPKRISPVFRDRSDASASPSLDDAIQTALEHSGFLIVLCSPEAAASTWVNREIEYYRSLGRSDRIIAVIVDGDPVTFDESKAPRGAFPPALIEGSPYGMTDREPLAADLRLPEFGGDGERLSILKIVSAILSVSLVQITKRDRAQTMRTRRFINFTLPIFIFISVLFVEILLLFPTLENFIQSYSYEKARIASDIIEIVDKTPSDLISSEFVESLLFPQEIERLSINKDGLEETVLPLGGQRAADISATLDLRSRNSSAGILSALPAMTSEPNSYVRIIADHDSQPDESIDMLVSDAVLSNQIWTFVRNIFVVSLAISTAMSLVQFFVLRWAFRAEI